MTAGTVIKSVMARQIFSDRGHPGVEATVVVENGAVGVAMATAGISIGEHEIQFVYDNDPKYYNGMGVNKAVSNVNDIIAPKIKGIDACRQRDIDQILLASIRKHRRPQAAFKYCITPSPSTVLTPAFRQIRRSPQGLTPGRDRLAAFEHLRDPQPGALGCLGG